MTLIACDRAPSKSMPRDWLPDSSLGVALDPYGFITARRRALNSDIFECTLLLRSAICIGGPGAARAFYDTSNFRRAGVVPRPVRKTLLGEGGVHGLDGPEHRARKAMFLAFMGPQCLDDFRDIVRARSKEALARWRGREVIVLDEARRIFFKAIMDWASIPYTAGDVESRSNDLMAMIEGFGSLGLRHLHGRLARHRSEQWIANLLAETRGGRIHPRAGSALAEIARHPLPLNVATVELLNVIRPIMAAAYFVDVAAAALQLHRHLRGPVGEDAAAADRFVQDVRRSTAFTPFLGAEACRDVDFNGQVIPRGSLVVLDVHGIHRDARIWPGAAAFDPDRFLERPYDRFNILQQGGGDHAEGHRCAGEWLTIEALKRLSKRLAAVKGVASVSNLLFDLRRVPARLREPIRLRVA